MNVSAFVEAVGTDLGAFRREYARGVAQYKALLGRKNLRTEDAAAVKRIVGAFVAAFEKAVVNNQYRYIPALLDPVADAPPPISDEILLRELTKHRCLDKYVADVDEVACKQTEIVMTNYALSRKLLSDDELKRLGNKRPAPVTYGYVDLEPTRNPTEYQPLPPDTQAMLASQAPLKRLSQAEAFNVEPQSVVLDDKQTVMETVAMLATLNNGVRTGRSRAKPGEIGVFADADFAAGDFVTEFAGKIYSHSRATALIRDVPKEKIVTLRAGVWLLVGYECADDPTLRGRGVGSLAVSALDVCASISREREVMCAEANCVPVLMTDAANAAASEEAFVANRAHVVLMATKAIGRDDELVVDLLRLSYFTGQ